MFKKYVFSYRGGEMDVTVKAESDDAAKATFETLVKDEFSKELPNGHVVTVNLWFTHTDMWELVDVVDISADDKPCGGIRNCATCNPLNICDLMP